jgi:hypothetical protein
MIISLGSSGDFVGKGRGGVDHGERPQRLGCEEDGEGCFIVRFSPFDFDIRDVAVCRLESYYNRDFDKLIRGAPGGIA